MPKIKTEVGLRYGGVMGWYATVVAYDSEGVLLASDEVCIGDYDPEPEKRSEVKKLRKRVYARARHEDCKTKKEWGVEYWKYPC